MTDMNDYAYDVCITLLYPNGEGIDLDQAGEIGSISDLRVEDIGRYLDYATNLWYDAVARRNKSYWPMKPNHRFGVRWVPAKNDGDAIQTYVGSFSNGAETFPIGKVEVGFIGWEDEPIIAPGA
jgi:hypothetical protein